MNGRQRVLTSLSHQEPDRVPLDIGGSIVTGIDKNVYNMWKSYLGLNGSTQIIDHIQGLAFMEGAMKGKLHIDVDGFFPNSHRKHPPLTLQNGVLTFRDEWGIVWRKPSSSLYFDVAQSPLQHAQSVHDIESHHWPKPSKAALNDWEIEAEHRDSRRLTIIESFGSGIFEMATRLRGYEQFLTDLFLNPTLAEAILDHILQVKMEYIDLLAQHHIPCDVLREGDDLATQQSLLFSRQMYRAYLFPRHRDLFAYVRKKLFPNPKIFFHSCGAIAPLLPDLIEAGIDIINPVQFSASGMNVEQLKKEFGDVLTFWGGGVDTQATLPYGQPDQVKEEVKRQIDILAPNGGFVFAAVHNIQNDVPLQNVLAMWEAWEENSRY